MIAWSFFVGRYCVKFLLYRSKCKFWPWVLDSFLKLKSKNVDVHVKRNGRKFENLMNLYVSIFENSSVLEFRWIFWGFKPCNGYFSEAPEEDYDHRTLFERLEEQRQKKELEYEETHKLSSYNCWADLCLRTYVTDLWRTSILNLLEYFKYHSPSSFRNY